MDTDLRLLAPDRWPLTSASPPRVRLFTGREQVAFFELDSRQQLCEVSAKRVSAAWNMARRYDWANRSRHVRLVAVVGDPDASGQEPLIVWGWRIRLVDGWLDPPSIGKLDQQGGWPRAVELGSRLALALAVRPSQVSALAFPGPDALGDLLSEDPPAPPF